MTKQFLRNVEVRIIGTNDTLVLNQGLDTVFEVRKDRSTVPNEAVIGIKNLSTTTKKMIKSGMDIELHVGYDVEKVLLARMTVESVQEDWQPPDSIFKIVCYDGIRYLRDKNITLSFKENVSVRSAIIAIIKQLNINVKTTDVDLNVIMKSGYSHTGKASQALDDVLDYVGAKWGIVNNTLIITKINTQLGQPVLKISPQNGLIQVPQRVETSIVTERLMRVLQPTKAKKSKARKKASKPTPQEAQDFSSLLVKKYRDLLPTTTTKKKKVKRTVGRKTGAVRVKRFKETIVKVKETAEGVDLTMLLRPQLNPFDAIEVNSRGFNGVYIIDEVEHVGGNRTSEFYTKVKAYERK
jgi:hypothetical protein